MNDATFEKIDKDLAELDKRYKSAKAKIFKDQQVEAKDYYNELWSRWCKENPERCSDAISKDRH